MTSLFPIEKSTASALPASTKTSAQIARSAFETKADAEQRYWGNRLIAAAEAKNAGDPDRARKIFEDVGARCPDKEIVKMAHQELTLMGK